MRAATPNKFAPDPSLTRRLLLRSATDLEARSSRRVRCGGDGDPVVEFCPPVPSSRRRALRCRCGTREVVQELADGRRLRRRRWRVRAAVVFGDLVCFCWMAGGPSRVLRMMGGGSASLLRRRRAVVVVPELGGGFGARPRPMCHNVSCFALLGGLLFRPAKLMFSDGSLSSSGVMVLRLPFSGCSSRRRRIRAASDGVVRRELLVPGCFFCFSRVLCAYALGHLFVQCLLGVAYVYCTAFFSL